MIKTILSSAAIAIALPAVASAATTTNVESPVQQLGIGYGGMYDTELQIGDVASVDVVTRVDGDTTSSLGFTYSPTATSQSLSVTLNDFETALYGSLTGYLSMDDTVSADDVSGTATAVSMAGGTFQFLNLTSNFTTGSFYVLLEWDNDVNNSFSYDIAINEADVAPVPVPAAGLLLLGGLGGFAFLRRRAKA